MVLCWQLSETPPSRFISFAPLGPQGRPDSPVATVPRKNKTTHLDHEVAVPFRRHHDNGVVQLLVEVDVRRRSGGGGLLGETHAPSLGAS